MLDETCAPSSADLVVTVSMRFWILLTSNPDIVQEMLESFFVSVMEWLVDLWVDWLASRERELPKLASAVGKIGKRRCGVEDEG